MSKFKIGWTVKVINYGSAPKMTMESRGNVIEITKEDGVYWYGVKFNTKYENWNTWWYEERNLEQVWPVDEKKYKRVFAKDIKVGYLCLGVDRSEVYKVKNMSTRQDSTIELYSFPINSTNPFEAYVNIFDPHEIVHVVEEEPMTTSVEDIQKEIAKAQETLNQLQKKLDEEKNKKWEPKGGRIYVSTSGRVGFADSSPRCKNNGVEFETKEAADKASIAYRRYHRLYKLAEELNEGWEPNWTERSNKFYIYYDHYNQNYEYSNDSRHSRIDSVYFKDEHVVEKAIKIIRNGGLD